MTSTLEVQEFEDLSGYSDTRELLVTRYNRGPRSVYAIALPLHLIPSHLPKPDPDQPFEGNRRVDALHAKRFGTYWRENQSWTCPPILLDTNADLDFEGKFKAAGVEVGILSLPHNTTGILDLLDGQHRTLGWYLEIEDIARELKRFRAELQSAKKNDDHVGAELWTAKIKDMQGLEKRLRTEYVTMELLGGLTLQEHKQAFADITNNAKGITKSKTVEFDSVSVLNRVTRSIAEDHELLAGRVDFELDRPLGKNENLLSARNVSDITRHVALGIKGRMNPRREKSFTDQRLQQLVSSCFDCLVEAFPELQDIISGAETPSALRKSSLLGSPTILRVLAGVFHNLAVDQVNDIPELREDGYENALAFFEKLAPHMDAPVLPGDPWHDTGYFPEEGGMAPMSRAQDLSGLTQELTDWAEGSQPLPF